MVEGAFGYASYGTILCGPIGAIDTGYQFGQLALKMLERFNAKELKARAQGMVYLCIEHWKEPVKQTLPFLLDSYQTGLDTGDLEWAGISALGCTLHSWFSGKNLADLRQESAAFSIRLTQLKQTVLVNQIAVFQQAISTLLESSAASSFAADWLGRLARTIAAVLHGSAGG